MKKKLIYILIFALVSSAFACGGCARPSIREAGAPDHDFFLGDLSSYKKVFRLEVWSHSRDIRLWELGLRNRQNPLKQGKIRYGSVPAPLQRVFPVRESIPAAPRPGEIMIVRVSYDDDQFMAPGSGSATRAFRVDKNRNWVIASVPAGARKPIWNSEAVRAKFIASIRGELDGPNKALFLLPAKGASPRARAIELLKQYAGETDQRKAYINLRFRRELSLAGWKLGDISVLADFKNLRKLYLNRNNIRDVSPLKRLRNLEVLSLGDNPIQDAAPLAPLTNLTLLDLAGTGISNLAFVRGMRKLHSLGAADNCIRDMGPIGKLKNLSSVDLAGNQISDARPIKGAVALDLFSLRRNRITDAAPLVEYYRAASRANVPRDNPVLDLTGNTLKNPELLRKPWMKKVRVIYPGFAEDPGVGTERPAPNCSS